MSQWFQENWQWLVSTFVTIVGILIGAYFAWPQARQARARRGEDFYRALNEGHKWREHGEKPWHTYEEKEERENTLKEADNAYKRAYEYARTREEKALACFYRFICAEIRAGLTENVLEREDLLTLSKTLLKKGLCYSRQIMIKEALSEAHRYAERFEKSRHQNGLSENMANILYRKATKWERNREQKAQIAFEYGKWCYQVEDYEAAKEAFQLCQRLNPKHNKVHFEMAMTDISLGPECYSSAVQNLKRHLEINPDDSEAHKWLKLLSEERAGLV
jgi:tetratricopeptide (TPR) repeat protein